MNTQKSEQYGCQPMTNHQSLILPTMKTYPKLAYFWLLGMLVCICVFSLGCDKPSTQVGSSSGSNTAANSAQQKSSGAITSGKRTSLPDVIKAGKVEFRVGEGDEVFSFRPKDEGTACKLYNSSDEELCKLSFSDGKLKVKTKDDKPLFELKPKDSKMMLKDATGEIELFKLKFKGDTIDFYKPNDERIYRIKKQDYGWRLEDNNDKTLFRAKDTGTKKVLRSLDDKTVLYSNDIPGTLGLVFFRIDELTLEQQAACCLMFLDK